jgi:hypothetical protein
MPKIANVKMPMTKDGTIDKRYVDPQIIKKDGTRDKRCCLIGDIRKSENPSCKNK